jgi:hypothetical protein
MGADRSKIIRIESVANAETGEEEWIDLRKDLAAIETELAKDDYRLLIIDPINNYLDPATVDTYRDSSIRAVLSPLADMAQRMNVCVVGIRHLKKSREGDMLDWGVGSVAYGAVARVVLTIVWNPFDEDGKERLLVPVETNLTAKPKPQAFQIALDEQGDPAFEWLGEREYSKDAIMERMREEKKGAAKKQEKQTRSLFRDVIEKSSQALTPRELARELKVPISNVLKMLYDAGPEAYQGDLDTPIRTEFIHFDSEDF